MLNSPLDFWKVTAQLRPQSPSDVAALPDSVFEPPTEACPRHAEIPTAESEET